MRTGIICFSGTGNTWSIAEQYALAFTQRGREVTLRRLEDVVHTDVSAELASYDLLGLGYPIHAFNAPRLMAEFITHLPRAAGQGVFLFVTAGGSVGGAFDWAREHLTHLGYTVLHEARYYASNNLCWAGHAPAADRTAQAKRLTWLAVDAQEAVAEIVAGSERHIYANDLVRLLGSHLVWWLYLLGCRFLHWHFSASSQCDGCGLCVRTCPTTNIRLADGRLHFGTQCTFCMRCLNVCPQRALQAWPFGPMSETPLPLDRRL
jgi:ferredoxin